MISEPVLEVNGILYYEKNVNNPDGSFELIDGRSKVKWLNTEANDGFDLTDDMEVRLVFTVGSAESEARVRPKTTQIYNIESSKTVIGNYETDPNNYFEQCNLSSLGIYDFIGLSINGSFFAHSNTVSYNKGTGVLSVAGMVLLDSDEITIIYNKVY
jgi:hypothetical protein